MILNCTMWKRRKSSDEEIRRLLNVPSGYTVLNLIALGDKAEEKKEYTEADFGKVYFKKY